MPTPAAAWPCSPPSASPSSASSNGRRFASKGDPSDNPRPPMSSATALRAGKSTSGWYTRAKAARRSSRVGRGIVRVSQCIRNAARKVRWCVCGRCRIYFRPLWPPIPRDPPRRRTIAARGTPSPCRRTPSARRGKRTPARGLGDWQGKGAVRDSRGTEKIVTLRARRQPRAPPGGRLSGSALSRQHSGRRRRDCCASARAYGGR